MAVNNMAASTIIKQEPLENKLHISDTYDETYCIKEESIDIKEEPVNARIEETCTHEDLSSTVIKEEDEQINGPNNVNMDDHNKMEDEEINGPDNVKMDDNNKMEDEEINGPDNVKMEDEKPLYKCEICNEDLKTRDCLKMHMPTHGDKVYACDGCSKGFHIRKRPETQETSCQIDSSKIHECSICHKQYIVRIKFEEHMRSHTGDKPYECNFCPKKYVSKYSLGVHLRTHAGEKPYKCHVCSKRFRHKCAQETHVQSHKDSGPHECNVCRKQFTTKSSLTKHMNRHTEGNSYVCGLCDKGFEKLKSLMVHMGVHERKMAIEKCNSQIGAIVHTVIEENT